MTMNNRPVQGARLQKALDDIKKVYARYGFAGAAMVISPEEAAFFYAMHAPWSAIRFDPDSPLGWRFRAVSGGSESRAELEAKVEGAMHTICQLADFGFQTQEWMEQMKALLRKAGIDFEHTPFGGRPLPPLMLGNPPP